MNTNAANLKTDSKFRQILECWEAHTPTKELIENLCSGNKERISASGLAGSSSALLINSLSSNSNNPTLVIVESAGEAQDLYEDLLFIMQTDAVGFFPSRQILPYDFRAPVGEIMGQRISTLAGLAEGRVKVVVAPVRALMEPTISTEQLSESSLHLKRGDEIELDDLVARLVKLGFRRVPLVEEVGDFALRGGLIDFFTPGAESPVRIELFGDEIETIRQFDVATQRTIDRIDRVEILPKREVPITQETLETYLEKLPENDSDYIRGRYLNDPELPGLFSQL